MQPGIYVGSLRHRRFAPRRHDFTYPVFMAFLDVDRVPELARVSPFLSYNRWNWASFDDRDHFGDPKQPLRHRLTADAARHGLRLPGGPIFLLTNLRYLGYCFNPVSFFYFYGQTGRLEMMMAEVSNTFGDSENYWLWSGNEWATPNARRYRCPKVLHVSPFMKMELDYTFIFTEPGEQLVAHMNTLDDGKNFFDATLQLARRPWSAPALHAALASHPWMTAKVVGAIHFQALLLYFKRLKVFRSPARGERRVVPETTPAREVKSAVS